MIAFSKEQTEATSSWQDNFLAMLTEIESRLRRECRDLRPDAREEAVREGVAHCVFAYLRLHERGRIHFATPFTLVLYSARHVRRGRPAAGSMNSKDPLSQYAQLGNGIRVDSKVGEWIEELVEDKRAPVPELVAAKMDVGTWFSSLSHRMKQIAKDMAFGSSTKELAEKHGVTAGRISQMRRSLERSWAEFQGEVAPALA
jgi:hypothetical protein